MARRPIFQQEWWLQAASRGAVETVEVRWDAIKVGALSFVRNRHFGVFVSLRMPPYTRTAGPVLTLPQSSPVQSAINTRRVIAELVAALPRHDSLFLLLDPEDPTAFAFSVNGCAVAQQFTFRVPHGMPTSLIWSGMASSTRRLIRSVQGKLTVERHLNLDRYQALTNRDHPEAKSTHDFTALRCLFDEASAIASRSSVRSGKTAWTSRLSFSSGTIRLFTTGFRSGTGNKTTRAPMRC
jgi:hypothetical protein